MVQRSSMFSNTLCSKLDNAGDQDKFERKGERLGKNEENLNAQKSIQDNIRLFCYFKLKHAGECCSLKATCERGVQAGGGGVVHLKAVREASA